MHSLFFRSLTLFASITPFAAGYTHPRHASALADPYTLPSQLDPTYTSLFNRLPSRGRSIATANDPAVFLLTRGDLEDLTTTILATRAALAETEVESDPDADADAEPDEDALSNSLLQARQRPLTAQERTNWKEKQKREAAIYHAAVDEEGRLTGRYNGSHNSEEKEIAAKAAAASAR